MKKLVSILILVVAVLGFAFINGTGLASADEASDCAQHKAVCCGGGDTATKVSINIGCTGQGNAIADMLFSILRILTDGVGLVVIGSIAVAGIQYSASQGNPEATARAVNRIRSSVLALFLYIFGFALINWLVPGGFL